jgi:hypothetical protein
MKMGFSRQNYVKTALERREKVVCSECGGQQHGEDESTCRLLDVVLDVLLNKDG